MPSSGIEPKSPTLQADALPFEPPGKSLLKAGLGYISGDKDGTYLVGKERCRRFLNGRIHLSVL